MQVMYAHNLSTVMLSPKEKSYMPDVFSPKPIYDEKPLEQVVPDVTVPPCYLTPEPSPVSSPEPPKKCEAVHTIKDTKLIDPMLIAKHICALKQRQLNANVPLNPNGEPRKLLPSLDVNYVDSFFNEIDNVSLTREEEIRLLQNIAREKINIKEEPLEQEACKGNHDSLTNDFDIEEFLQFTEKPKENVVQVKLESRSDDQQVMSFENSPSPSSPYSTISAADEKFTGDDFSSFALTPESGFESDSLDDVLDTDWDLESVKMDMSMASTQPNLPAFRMTPDIHPEPELYQLKQLISSCTPSGKFLQNKSALEAEVRMFSQFHFKVPLHTNPNLSPSYNCRYAGFHRRLPVGRCVSSDLRFSFRMAYCHFLLLFCHFHAIRRTGGSHRI